MPRLCHRTIEVKLDGTLDQIRLLALGETHRSELLRSPHRIACLGRVGNRMEATFSLGSEVLAMALEMPARPVMSVIADRGAQSDQMTPYECFLGFDR